MLPALFSDSTLHSILDYLSDKEVFVFLETTKINQEERYSYLFLNPIQELVCKKGDDPIAFLEKAESLIEEGMYLAGWVSFEFGYLLEPVLAKEFFANGGSEKNLLARFWAFSKPYIYDHFSNSFTESFHLPVEDHKGQDRKMDYSISNLGLNMEKQEYMHAFQKVKSYISAGDTYQVNYTLKFKFGFEGSPSSLYENLRRNQSVSYGAYIKGGGEHILSFSPELFFRKRGPRFTVRPMKGTIKRGRTLSEDEELISFLKIDSKTLSENVMIVDLLRNDLGRLLGAQKNGGVSVKSLFDVETFETLHQMTSTIQGHFGSYHQKRISLKEQFKALFPCGSVTGAPKIRTMEIIRELEQEDRGVYTGAIGFFSPRGEGVFNVPIRTVVLKGSKGEMGTGSGIIYDSDSENEWDECKLKARFLTETVPEFKLFETMLWKPEEGFWLLELHLKRLAQSAQYFAFPLDQIKVKSLLQNKAETFSRSPKRVRLTLSRAGSIAIEYFEYEGFPKQNNSDEIPKVCISDKKTESKSVYYFHKTTRRELYNEERKKAVAAGFFEILFQNEKGEITEGSISNVFIKKGEMYFTPPVQCGLLNGVFRQHFLKSQSDKVEEKALTVKDLKEADGVFVANSVRGMTAVEVEY